MILLLSYLLLFDEHFQIQAFMALGMFLLQYLIYCYI